MSNEKKTNAEELVDEQVNEAAGGVVGSWTSKSKKCANPNCTNVLPYNYSDSLCPKCREAAGTGRPTVNYRP